MSLIVNIITALMASLGGFFCWVFDGLDSLFYALVAFVALDYITGVLLAIQNKKLSSYIGFKGISKKILMFLLVGMGNIIDKYVIGSGNTLKNLLVMFYLSNEGISIIENAGSMGLPLPKKLKDILQQLNQDVKN